MKRIASTLLVVVMLIGVGLGGYALGRQSRTDVQTRAFNISTGQWHWVTLNRAGCNINDLAHFEGRAVCSWLGQVRVAP